MKRLLIGTALWLMGVAAALAQAPVTFGNYLNGLPAGSALGTADQIYVRQGGTSKKLTGAVLFSGSSSWFDNAYCSTVGYVIVRFTGAWTCSNSVPADPTWWGADATGAADSAGALNSALAASKIVRFPPGTFKFNSQISKGGSGSVTIEGSGQDVTILNWANATNGIVVSFPDINTSAHIRNLTIATSQQAGGNGIVLTTGASFCNPANTAISDLTNVTFRGFDGYTVTDYWTNGLAIVGVSNVQIANLAVFGKSTINGIGIGIQGIGGTGCAGSAPAYSVAVNINRSTFYNLAIGLNLGNSYVQGVTIEGTNFTGGTVGIESQNSGTGLLEEISVTNSQFNPSAAGFGIAANYLINDLFVSNSLFILPAGAFGIIAGADVGSIAGNVFGCQSAGSGTGISVLAGSGMAILGNTITSCATGLSLAASVQNVVALGNSLLLNTAALSNSSAAANNLITNNLGYNPVGVSAAATMGASPTTVTAGSSPEDHYIIQSATNTGTCTKGTRQVAALKDAATYYHIALGPNESYVCTWTTTAPTYTKDVH